MRHFLLLILCLVFAASRMDAAPAVEKIDTAIRKLLPKGWSATSSKGRVVIVRDQPVVFYVAVSLPSNDPGYLESLAREGKRGTFKIQLIITPLLTQRDYSDIKSSITREQLYEKARIPNQEMYSESRIGLPECHGSDYSVYISTSRHPYQLVWPEDQNQEWQHVVAAVKSLFTEYK